MHIERKYEYIMVLSAKFVCSYICLIETTVNVFNEQVNKVFRLQLFFFLNSLKTQFAPYFSRDSSSKEYLSLKDFRRHALQYDDAFHHCYN